MRTIFLLVITAFLVSPASADDWPHWMGPQRDNVWREDGLIDSFPEDGPPEVWRTEIAGGYAGPAVSQGRVVLTDYVTADDVQVPNFERNEFTGQERVLCLNEVDGDLIWKQEYPVNYSISYPAGPRCTPAIVDNLVYTLGSEGDLYCFDLENGDIVWSKNLKEAYQTQAPLWGYAAHPLIDGDRLITLAGGEGSHVVALNRFSGEEIWRSLTSPEQGYSPPTIIESGGVRQLILLRPDAVTSVSPDSGAEYWSIPYEASNGSIIMSPAKVGNLLYVGGFSQKSLLLELDPDKPAAEELWRDKRRDAISPVNVQPIAVGRILYGCDQGGSLCALELPEGNRLWATGEPVSRRPVGSGTAFLVRQEDRFWIFTENGDLVIARLTAEGFEEFDRARIIEPTNTARGREVVWCMPAFANKRVYVRNDKEIVCVDLAED